MSYEFQKNHTGLFVDGKKCGVLLDIVQDLLRTRYRLVAVPGPRLADDTCEIVLYPLSLHSGVNLPDAKVLLAKYLHMIKEPAAMFAGKEPELIDLDASDDEYEASVITVELDDNDESIKRQNSENISSKINGVDSNVDDTLMRDIVKSKQKSPSKSPEINKSEVLNSSQLSDKKSATIENLDDSDVIIVDYRNKQMLRNSPNLDMFSNSCDDKRYTEVPVTLDDSEVIFVDSIPTQNSPSKSLSFFDVDGVLIDRNKNSKKRKKGSEGEIVKGLEVIDILDDEVIVLDDSYTSNPRAHCSTSEPSAKPSTAHTVQTSSQSEIQSHSTSRSNDEISHSASNLSSSTQPHSEANEKLIHQNVTKVGENQCGNNSLEESLCNGPPKKKSKLAYHRPAHLVRPLTRPSVAAPSSKVDTASNIYNPNADASAKQTGLRPIVIDGNNVAIGYGKGKFSLKGIQICINYFEKRGHRQIKVFIPQYRRNRDTFDELHRMERNGLVVMTPSRKVNGKMLASYDDRYIVQYAAEFGGVIVSTDNFRDLLQENPSWRETIENRLLMFTWVDDLLMFPQDPLGRNGPSLDDFLKFPDT